MTAYITFRHTASQADRVAATQLIAKDKNGNEHIVDWDESDWSYDNGTTDGRCKGIYIDGEYANRRLDEIKAMTGWNVDAQSMENPDKEVTAEITDLEFVDTDNTYSINFGITGR